ncbi:MAG: sugar transferase [Candidatus Bathyarchaeota archaeon]|nr:sugar transferase [Candidatus Bathyarchaeota archaeon]
MYQNFFKPLIDIVVAIMALIIFLPVFILVAIIILIVHKENPFFLQLRPGKNERLFKIIKFKTMTSEKDENGNLLPDSERLTAVGSFIRKTSLDEIPQLINILMGDMSLIGPRPLLPEYLEFFDKYESQRHLVKPGITGWAAVNGRNAISWKKKFQYDVWYVKNISFLLDLKILRKTFLKVLRSEGINMENVATTEPYNGNN